MYKLQNKFLCRNRDKKIYISDRRKYLQKNIYGNQFQENNLQNDAQNVFHISKTNKSCHNCKRRKRRKHTANNGDKISETRI